MDPTFPLVPIANFVACLLVLSSLTKSMFQSWNVGACSFAIWIAVESLTRAINSIIWARSVENKAPVWCDISISIKSLLRMMHLTFSAQSYTHRHCFSCSCTCCIFCNHPACTLSCRGHSHVRANVAAHFSCCTVWSVL